ncbi:MAG: oligosaccharide flippase family protein [Bacteroidota bacterium]|nr:oligosaccharide flippase family protein [Bacteroidota bacterium]
MISSNLSMKNRISVIFNFAGNLINKGHDRSVKAKKNIIASFFIKGISIAISLILVPLTINYVNPTQYGIWLTLSSIIGWFAFFDIGFGNGLRNKFAEAIAKGEHELARIYLSTTYAILGIIVITLLLIFFCINPFLNWSVILNTPSNMAGELSILALLVFSFFCLQFVLQLITTIITANQQPAKASFFNLLGSLLSLTIIFILTKTTSGNLIYLALSLGFTPILVLTASSMWFYRHDYKRYAPSIKYVRFNCAPDLMSLGIKFFLLQIAGVILYQTSNIIIAQLFGPGEVTPYNVSYKYFSIITMIMGIIMMPFWSAYTEAWVKKDIEWIKKSIKKLQLLWVLLSLVTIGMFVFSNFFFRIWVGKEIKVPVSVSAIMAIYVIMNSWTNIYSLFLNGTGKLKLQLYASIFGMVLNIPMSIYFGKIFGISGVLLSTVILCFINMIIEPIQTRKLLNNNAKGVWNK